jgi:hypothetical protein
MDFPKLPSVAEGPDVYGRRHHPIDDNGPREIAVTETNGRTREDTRALIADVVKQNGSDGAKAVRTLGEAVLQSATAFNERCEETARLMSDAAQRLAAQAGDVLKVIHDSTAEVERRQRDVLATAAMIAGNDLRRIAGDADVDGQ